MESKDKLIKCKFEDIKHLEIQKNRVLMREWDWTIDEYNKHIKKIKGMRGTNTLQATGDYDVIDIIQDYKLNFNRT